MSRHFSGCCSRDNFFQVLSNLREATQSHNVRKHRKDHDAQKSTVCQNPGKSRSKNSNSSSVTKLDKTAVILFEDVDIVFDDVDEGFYNAVNSLIATTKRPIIMTTSNLNFLKSG